MEKEALTEWLDKRVRSIQKNAESVKPGFFPERIHQFRTETKKLRAMMRLIGMEAEEAFSLPKPFRKIYRAAGAVRDRQMQLQYLAADKRHTLPAFTVWLAHQAGKAARAWSRAHSIPITRELADYVSQLPTALSDLQTLLRYYAVRLEKLKTLTAGEPDDDALHEVRKLAKDMGYVLHVCKDDWAEAWHLMQPMEKSLERLSDRAGAYNDRRNLLDSLQQFGKDYDGELNTLQETRVTRAAADWTESKMKERSALCSAIRQLIRRARVPALVQASG